MQLVGFGNLDKVFNALMRSVEALGTEYKKERRDRSKDFPCFSLVGSSQLMSFIF